VCSTGFGSWIRKCNVVEVFSDLVDMDLKSFIYK